MRWSELIETVRETGQYDGAADAERVTRVVLSALGGHVVGTVRADLARQLPPEAARLLADRIPAARPLTAAQFVESVAKCLPGATPATARWDVSSVLTALARAVDGALVDRLLGLLPSGYALLFGRAELVRAA
ncbi:DUF2267 domain-containing protein [Streptomyces sp. Je 1-369]|uniref:DUF2267 domain-containing protein n=1 Tax=Streptomyces sp. Je 1-369 TaxID=2966192 RepID=UPI002286116E|nr:DUF2267 domain-containing protein [Streptomyces sp. Je 1-369]WAL97569.1 DUF2267 domain-containing protein [Streptomyces sp. Je 1-369]